MKRRLISSLLTVLFSIVIVLVLFCLTLLNDNFVIRVLKNNNYYSEVYKELMIDINTNYKNDDCSIDKDILEDDINRYFKKDFKVGNIKGNIECKSKKDLKSVYINHIKLDIFDNVNMTLVYYLSFIVVIFLVVIVGSLFIKTKNSHDIFNIFIGSFPINILIYGLLYIFIDTDVKIVNELINVSLHLLLGISIILFEIGIFKKIKTRLFK